MFLRTSSKLSETDLSTVSTKNTHGNTTKMKTVQLAYLDVELNYLRFHFYLFQVFIA